LKQPDLKLPDLKAREMAKTPNTPMIDDDGKDAVFREVDEELRREQMAKIWQQYGTYILGVAALIVVGVGGWKWLESRRIAQIEAASVKYDAANQLAANGKADDAQAALTAIAKSGADGYGLLAKLRLAAVAVNAGKTDAAVAAYEGIAANKSGDPILTDYAKLQIASLKLDKADWTESQNRLIALTDNANPWRYAARELMGVAAFKAGRFDDAKKFLETLIADRKAPASIVERARIIMGTIVSAELSPAAAVPPNSAAKADGGSASVPANAATPEPAKADPKKKK
jgi:hypothetical protein